MKITIESTDQLVQVENREGDCRCAVPGRVWVGYTDSGIQVRCVVTLIAAPISENLEQFDRELLECRPPEEVPVVFPLRMVL